jgi:hypothetical protein
MPDYPLTQCTFCKHWNKDSTCAAFPTGIPVEIWSGRHDHSIPFPNDNGIMREEDPSLEWV